MDNIDITSEKRIRVAIGVFVAAFLFQIFHSANLMSVTPTFLELKIAHAPPIEPIAILNLTEFMKDKYSE